MFAMGLSALLILDVSASYVKYRFCIAVINALLNSSKAECLNFPSPSPLRGYHRPFIALREVLKSEEKYKIQSLKISPPSSLLAFPSARCFSLPVIA